MTYAHSENHWGGLNVECWAGLVRPVVACPVGFIVPFRVYAEDSATLGSDLSAVVGEVAGKVPEVVRLGGGAVEEIFENAISGKSHVAFGIYGDGAKVLDCLEQLSRAIGLRQVRPGLMRMAPPTEAPSAPPRSSQ